MLLDDKQIYHISHSIIIIIIIIIIVLIIICLIPFSGLESDKKSDTIDGETLRSFFTQRVLYGSPGPRGVQLFLVNSEANC